jgi:hypothetical protein
MSVHVLKPWRHQAQLVDDAILAYVEWREECAEVWSTGAWWASVPSEDARRAHAAYQAALDREEAAANRYAMEVNRFHDLVETSSAYPVRPEVRFGRRT